MLAANQSPEPEFMKNDLQIQHEVQSELEHDDHIPAGAIGVEVHQGVVKLAGRISDPTAKRCAELDARRVPGVTSVVLDLDAETR
jgi:osmotically-inducible protein OsmY